MRIAGDHIDWDTMYNLFVVEENFQERQKFMISLTAIKNSSLVLT